MRQFATPPRYHFIISDWSESTRFVANRCGSLPHRVWKPVSILTSCLSRCGLGSSRWCGRRCERATTRSLPAGDELLLPLQAVWSLAGRYTTHQVGVIYYRVRYFRFTCGEYAWFFARFFTGSHSDGDQSVINRRSPSFSRHEEPASFVIHSRFHALATTIARPDSACGR